MPKKKRSQAARPCASRSSNQDPDRASRAALRSEQAAELQVRQTHELEKQLEGRGERMLQQARRRLLKEEVDEEDIAAVVAAGPAFRCRSCSKAKCRSCCISKKSCTTASSGRTKRSTRWRRRCLRARSGLKDPNRPIGSLHLPGTDRCGETELARALAEFSVRRRSARMIRIDMSEYQEKHTVSRLIGSASGLRRATKKAGNYGSGAPSAVLRGPVRRNRRKPTPTCSTCCCKCSTTGG